MMNYRIKLQGLHCEACKKIIQKRLGSLDGTVMVDVQIDQQTALVQTNGILKQLDVENVLKNTEYKVVSISED